MPEITVSGIKLVFSENVPNDKIPLITQAVAALSGTEVGRILLSYMPKKIKFFYPEGDSTSRAQSDPTRDRIWLYESSFSSNFERYDTIWHELSHQVQEVKQLEGPIIGKNGGSKGINSYLEGAHRKLETFLSDPNFEYVSAPLANIVNEETLARDITNLIWKLGYSRTVVNEYYIPGDESAGLGAVRTAPLTATEKGQLNSLIHRLQVRSNSPEQNRINWLAYEEFYRRARAAGWIGSDDAQMQRERELRGIVGNPQAAPKVGNLSVYVDIFDSEGDVVGGQLISFDADGHAVPGDSIQDIFERDAEGHKLKGSDGKALPPVGEIKRKGGLSISYGFRDGTRERISADILIPGNPPLDFSSAGGILGQQLGYRLAGGNALVGVVASTALKTLGDNLGDVFDGVLFSANGKTNGIGEVIDEAFSEFGDEFLTNLQAAGIGAVSSFLTGALIDTVGLDGFAGALANTSAGYAIGQIASNIAAGPGHTPFDGLSLTQLGNTVGGFLGAKLAAEIIQFDTIGGQLGAAVGTAIGTIVATSASVGLINTLSFLGSAAGPVGAAIGAFVGFIAGGLIGSIFGGTPRSGADTRWDSGQNKFVVDDVWSRKGGSKDAAKSLASAAVETLNSILSSTGGTLLNPKAVQAGNYGMRKSDYVYQTTSLINQNAITFRVSSKQKDSLARVVGYGIVKALTDPDFQIAGGNVLIKRALYNTFELFGVDASHFDSNMLSGNIASAQHFETYLTNAALVNSLITVAPDSVLASETLITLARADELGLTKRHRSDWFGGFGFRMTEGRVNAGHVEFGFGYDIASGQTNRVIGFGLSTLGDAIDIAGQTTIVGTALVDTIDLRNGKLASQIGYTVNGRLINDIAAPGADFTAKIALETFAANSRRTTVTVVLTNDGIEEATETFLANLSDAPAMQIMGGAAVGTIIDEIDALPTLMVGDSYAWENDGHAVFRLSLSKAASTAITVSLALSDDRAAGSGVDFGSTGSGNLQVSTNGVTWTDATSVTFVAGVTELFVRTPVSNDNALNPNYTPGGSEPQYLNVEGNERFSLSAKAIAGASSLTNGTETVKGTGTIVAGTGSEPLVWIDDVVVYEATGQATFTISRSRSLATATTIGFATSDRRVLDIDIAATVDGGDGNDTIYASNLGDNLFGGAGNDRLYGGRLDDWLLGGDGDDILDAGTADPLALGGDGNYLNGGAGNDILRGREGSDWLEGGDGVDTLTGGAGDDILTGGAGDGDNLKGGLGNDQYLVRLGDGADIAEEDGSGAPTSSGSGDAITQRMAAIEAWKINPSTAGAIRPDWLDTAAGVQQGVVSGGEDAVVFGTGIEIGDIRMQRAGTSASPGNDLIIQIMQTDAETGIQSFSGTQLTVKDWFSNPFKRIEWLKFVDGTEIRIGDITSFIVGGAGNDILVGTAGNDFIYGGAGNDQLFLLAGDDIGNGASGNDLIWGYTGRDLLIGGTGNDELLGGAGSDAISGDAGADYLYGGADRDILSGGRGDGDLVVGGAGDDTFKYARGDGHDTYFDDFSNHWDVVWTSAGQWNTAAGYNYNALTGEVTGPGGALIRKNFGTAAEPDFQWVGRLDFDSVNETLKVFNPPVGASITANSGVDTIEFAPGISLQDIILRRLGNDLIMAVSDDNLEANNLAALSDSITIKDWYLVPGQIEKLAFYATGVLDIAISKTNLVAGTDGHDGTLTTPLAGSSIADWITAGGGDDVVAGGAGNDIIAGNAGSDTLRGEAGDDVLYGGTGNDILDGGTGKDILIGGSGIDTASYASASAAVRVRLSYQSNNGGDAAGDEYNSIENVTGGSAADNIGADAGDNEIDGGAGADTLMGGAGDDTYIWATTSGADTIREGAFTVDEAVTSAGVLTGGYMTTWTNTGTSAGSGKFYWRLEIRGPGNELVYDYTLYSYAAGTALPAPAAWNAAGWLGGFAKTNGQQVTRDRLDTTVSGGDQDSIEFAAGISLSDLTFIRALGGSANASGPDLIIRYNNAAATQITVKDHFTVYGRIETLQFNDGQAVSLASILSATSTAALHGTASDDLLIGQTGSANDTLYGGDGDDVLSGLGGNDALYGEDGDDVLEGGAGADRLDGGANPIGGSGDTVRYVRSAAVNIDLRKTTAQSGGDAEGDTLFGIENVVGSKTGNDTITGDDNANRIDALDGHNIIDGLGGDDVLIAGTGDDTIRGGAGDDNISAGGGNDQVWGGDGNDILVGGDGNDQLRGEVGNDMLLGGDGNDTVLDGGAGDDKIYGEGGNDTLTGGEGNDLLAGGKGTDTLLGGAGDDVYFVQSNDGQDIITDTQGTNIISFDDGITHRQIWMTQAGSNLKISVIGEDTVLTLTDFFASTGATRVRSIQTTTHAIFLDHPDTLNLIAAMTTASSTVPVIVPGTIVDAQTRYWHEGGKARPIVSVAPRAVTTNEDGTITIDGNYGVIDHDGNIAGYQLKDGAGPTLGVITGFNPATGALTYTPNADANGSDRFAVIVTDADGQAVEIPVEVTVTPVNDAPRSLAVKNGSILQIAESAPSTQIVAGTVVGLFDSIDIEGDAVSYSLVDDANGRFAMLMDGTLLLANPSGINFEASASHMVRVRATDAHGALSEQSFTVAVLDRNDANSLPASYSMTINENVAVSTAVGSVTATDLDQSGPFAQQHYYFLNGTTASATSSDGRYAINATTGQITVNSALNFEAASPSETYQVIARDNAGAAGYNQAQTAVTIGITDINEAPVSLNWTPSVSSVAERDKVAGTITKPAIALGTLSITDPDTAGLASATYTYTLSDARFEVVSGILRLKQDASFDYESASSVTVTVTGTDGTGIPFTINRAITIAVTNIDDIFEGTSSADTIGGQSGRDIISGFGGNDTLSGGAGNDQIDGGDGNDVIQGDAGDDTLFGQAGNDTLYGGPGDDILRGGADSDRLFGEDGNDSLYGEAGSDGVRATGSNPWRGFTQAGLVGGNGDDILNGGAGDDYLDGGAGADHLIGGDGFDGVDYSGSTAAVTVNLATGTGSGGHAQGDTLSGIELIQGSAFGDTLTGSAGSDVIYGGAGDDIIVGGAGNDYLFGGDGNDTIYADDGDDILDGGAGDDILNGGIDNDLYIVTRSSGADTINNYDPSGDDVDLIGFNDASGVINDQDLWFERIGNNLKISVVGTSSSVSITDWYVVADAESRANHKVDFIVANTAYGRTLNIEGLVTLMATKTKPANASSRDTLMSDLSYKAMWATYWNSNAAPALSEITQLLTNEDTAKVISVTATDDITPGTQIQLSAEVISGSNIVTNAGISFGAPNASGVRTMTINPVAHASGTARIRLTATDAGGISSSHEFDIIVNGVADTPTITQFASAGGTAGQAGGILLSLNISYPDADGSEVHEVWIAGVPSGLTLSAGTYDGASATWKLTSAQTAGLKLNAPAGWSSDPTLTATARASENGQTAVSAAVQLIVPINAPPTGASFSGTVHENAASGTIIGTVLGTDPDGDVMNYSMIENAGGRFTISAAGVVTVANGTMLNFETNTSHSITIRVTDQRGASLDRNFVIAVNNVNEANSLPASYAMSVNENVAVGTVVGTVTATDPDSSAIAFGQQRYYFLNAGTTSASSSDWRFVIDELTGQIRTAVGIDYEAGPASSIYTVLAKDNAGGVGSNLAQTSVSINAVNVNEAPYAPDNGVTKWSFLDETGLGNSPANAFSVVGAFSLTDPDGTIPLLRFSDGSTSQGWFYIEGNALRIHSGYVFDFEWFRGAGYTIHDWNGDGRLDAHIADMWVKAFDGSAWSTDELMQVFISDVNEAPNAPDNGVTKWSFLDETGLGSNPANTYSLVGAFDLSDPDGTVPLLRFSDGSTSQGWFYIDGNTVRINPGHYLDFEWFRDHGGFGIHDWNGDGRLDVYVADIWVKAFDGSAWSGDELMQVFISDVNEAHTLTSNGSNLLEGDHIHALLPASTAPIFDLRSLLMLNDPEGRAMTWTFADGQSQNGIWTIDGPTGQLYATTGKVDYEAITTRYETHWAFEPGSYTMTVYYIPVRDYSLATQALSIMATDGTHTATGTFTVNIVDVDEGPQLSWFQRFIIRDDQGNGNFGTLYGVDPETGAAATTYMITNIISDEQHRSPGGSSDIDNYANPTLSVGYTNGRLSFSNPGDGEWEGGIRYHPTLGGRWSYQLHYRVTVRMTDATGKVGESDFEVIFLKHGHSTVLPIAFDLDGNGLELISPENSAINFDMDLDGIADRTGWVGAGDGMLVLDRNGNGAIDDASEISFVGDAEGAVTDLEGLRAYDTNQDGYFDVGDMAFQNFLIWRDANQDGVSQASELRSLTEWGIRAINLSMTLTDADPDGEDNVIFATTDFERNDGTTGLVGDVFLKYSGSKIDDIAPPIVLDFDGDGASLTSLADSKTLFDMNGDGIADKTGWIKQGDAFLALDRNNNGTIDNISEISFVGDKEGAKTDLEGLTAFDSNGDGLLDGEDARFAEFRLWFDTNANGITDAGELLSLAEAGVTSINLLGIATGDTAQTGQNIVYNKSFFTKAGGSEGTLLDVGLAFKALSALPDIKFQETRWEMKSRKYRITANNGNVHVTPRNARGVMSADAGQISRASLLSFGNSQQIGLLSTILLDLDGDGLEGRKASKSGVLFDMNGDGLRDDTGWMSGGDGMLVIDRNGDGAITHASEISFLSEKEGARNAWEGLAALDSSKDNKLSSADARFGDLKLWIDRNGDGISQADEVKSLADIGISEINLRNVATNDSVKPGENLALSTSTFTWVNGLTATIGNVAIGFTPTASDSGTATRPMVDTARAAGSLAQAMSAFGTDTSQSVLRQTDMNAIAAQNWLSASAA